MAKKTYWTDVFINCPFDGRYKPLFQALVFAVTDCGYRPRCAKELSDGSQIRIEEILALIGDCRFGIHDISRTGLDSTTRLPRFNMPLELGMFLATKKFGEPHQRKKTCLILDTDKHRYHKFVSDIAGQDISAHGNKPEKAVHIIRDWLRKASPDIVIPSGEVLWARYLDFSKNLPGMCREVRLSPKSLIFIDYAWLAAEWCDANSF